MNEILSSKGSMGNESLEVFRALLEDHFDEIEVWVKDINNRLEGTGFSPIKLYLLSL